MYVRYIRCIRALYVVATSYILMRIVIFLGIAMNMTGVIPKVVSTAAMRQPLGAAIRNIMLLLLATIFYLVTEYVYYRRIQHAREDAPSCEPSKFRIIILAIIYLICFSFLNFQIVVHFISNYFPTVFIFNIILNLIPLSLIYKMLIHTNFITTARLLFVISGFVFTSIMVIPYGSIISNVFITYLL